MPETFLDAAVSRWFREISITEKGIEEFKKSAETFLGIFEIQRRDAKFSADRKLDICGERAHKARIKMLDGVISDLKFREIATAIENERQEILRKMPAEQAVRLKDLEPVVQVLKVLKNLSKIYPRLPAKEKSAFAKMFLLELRVTEDDIEIKAKKEVEALLKLPKQQSGWPGRVINQAK